MKTAVSTSICHYEEERFRLAGETGGGGGGGGGGSGTILRPCLPSTECRENSKLGDSPQPTPTNARGRFWPDTREIAMLETVQLTQVRRETVRGRTELGGKI